MDIAVPAYFYPAYPDPVWREMQTSVPTCEYAIANVNSGPGTKVDQNYARQITAARASGLKVLGYVHTSYGSRNVSLVQEEVNQWKSFYNPLDGIFYDEVSNNCATVTYYTGIKNYAKDIVGGTVIVNPGTTVPECMNNTGDIIVNFESSAASYANWKPAGWEHNFPPQKFWHIIHTASSGSMSSLVAEAKSRNAGNVYVTDKGLPNPYNALPSYWTSEVALVKQEK